MGTERRSLILRGALDICLLALLNAEGPIYGYELTERLAAYDLPVSDGSSYALLSRLEKAGLIHSEKRPSPAGPPRKYYSISDDGRAVLDRGRDEWGTVASSVAALLN